MQDTVYGIIADSEEPARHTEREREEEVLDAVFFVFISGGEMSKQMQIMSNKKKKKHTARTNCVLRLQLQGGIIPLLLFLQPVMKMHE